AAARGGTAGLLQAVRPGDRGRLAAMDAAAASALSGRGLRLLRRQSPHGGLRLAGVHGGCRLHAGDVGRERLSARPAARRARRGDGRQCATVLESEGWRAGVKKFFSGLTLVAAIVLASGCQKAPASSDGKLTIAVIPKGTSHVFWQSIHAGAEKAAREVGAEVIWRGPLREDDRASQVSEVEGFVTRGVSGIVLAPLDDSALVASVSDAARSKI